MCDKVDRTVPKWKRTVIVLLVLVLSMVLVYHVTIVITVLPQCVHDL